MKLYVFENPAGWETYAVMAPTEAEAEAFVKAKSLADHLEYAEHMRTHWSEAKQYLEANARAWHEETQWPNERRQMQVRIAEAHEVIGITKDE